MPCKMSCTSSRLSSPWSLPDARSCVKSSSQHGHRFLITLGCPLLLPSSDSTKASLGSPQPIASLRPIRPQLLDGLQALCFSAQLIIILLISGIFRNTCAITERFGLSFLGNNTAFFLNFVRLCVSFHSRLFSGFSAYGLHAGFLALYGPLGAPPGVFRTRRVDQVFFPWLSGLIC